MIKKVRRLFMFCTLFLLSGSMFCQIPPNLGAAAGFAIFTANGNVMNTGATTITGNIGTNSGNITGFPPGILIGTSHDTNTLTAAASTAANSAYSYMSGMSCGATLGTSLGSGQILTPNQYCIFNDATLTGNLVFDGQGNPNSVFMIKINGDLVAAAASSITLINGASMCNIYIKVNGQLNLGTNSILRGTYLVNGKIDFNTGAALLGRGISIGGNVTLKTNTVAIGMSPTASTITASGSTTLCAGSSVTLTGNNGGTWNTGPTTSSLVVNAGGTYYVTNTTNCGSINSNSIVVVVNAQPTLSVNSGTICNGSAFTLTVSGASTYSWAQGATLSATTGTNVIANPTITTTYSVTGTSSLGCIQTVTTSVTVISNPTITVNSASICIGSSATLTAGGATTFTWMPSVGLSSTTGATVVANPTTTTIYTVNGTAGTCSSVASSTVTVNPLPIINVNSATICPSASVMLTATGANTYSWSPALGLSATTGSTVIANPSVTNSYTITGTNGMGCTNTNTASVTLLPNATITVNSAAICSGSSTTLSASGAGSFSWSPGAGLSSTTGVSVIANPTTTTIYTITGLSGSCYFTQTATVAVNALPTATISASGTTTFCQGGSVTLTASSGSGYLWSTQATTQSIVVSTSGNYSVTVTDSNGCSATSSVTTVMVNPLPTLTVNCGIICNGSSATLIVSGANTYSWSPGTGLSATAGATVIANPGITTIYTITGTSIAGCVSNTTSTVTVVPSLTLTVNSASICTGSSATLTANGANSFTWSPSATLSSSVGAMVIANPTATTVYTITAMAGVCTATQTATVTVNALPTATLSASGTTTFCQGGSVTLTASNGSGYLWSNQATTQSIVVTASGNYSVTVTNVNGCSATSTVITVLVNPLPTVTVNNGTMCPSGSVILTASGGNTYSWSPGTGLSATTGATVTANPAITTTYSITGTSTAGCVNTTTASVTVLPSLTLSINSATICVGSSATLTANGANTYSWNPASTLSSSMGASVIANPTTTTVYTITGTVGNCSATQTATVTVNTLPAATIAVNGPTTFCQGGSVTLTASSGTSYIWSTGATSQSIVVNASGNYSVTVTNASGCSATSTIITILVNPLPIISVNDATICPGASATLIANGANTYLWAPGTGLSATTGATVIANPVGSATYIVTGTNTLGCVNTGTASVTVLPNLTLTVNSATICSGTSVMLIANGAGTYTWSPDATLSFSLGASVIANPTTTTVYTITATSGMCSAMTTATVTVNALPTATIAVNGATTFCQGGSVTLTASNGSAYLWSTSAISQSISVTASGNYSVTVTDANGCSATSSITTILVNSLPNATISVTGSTALCQGDYVILSTDPGSSYLWSNGATTQSIMVSNAGNYSVTVTNSNSCIATSTVVTVTMNLLPTATVAVTGSTVFCQGSSATLTASQGSGYLWSTGATSQSIIVTASGDYSVTVTGTNGCSATSAITSISVNPAPIVNLGNDTTACGCIYLNAYYPGATYLWSSGQDYGLIKVCNSGTYWVNVSNGICITTDTIKVTINPVPAVNISVITGSITTLIVGGTGSSYLWNTGATTQTIIANAPGIYYVTVTNQYGCSGSDTTMVGVLGTTEKNWLTIPLNIYPNPTYDKSFILNFDIVETSNVEIRIANTIGSLMYHEKLENFSGSYDKKMDFQNLAQGIYFVEVINGTRRRTIKIALN